MIKKREASDHGGVQIPDIFGSGKEKSDREPSAAKDYSPASASDLSLLSALKLADDVRQQQDSQRKEVNTSGIQYLLFISITLSNFSRLKSQMLMPSLIIQDSSNRKDTFKSEWTSRQRSHSEAFVIERISFAKAKRLENYRNYKAVVVFSVSLFV